MTVAQSPYDTTRENITETAAATPDDIRLNVPRLGCVFEVEGKTYLILNGATALDVAEGNTTPISDIPGCTTKTLAEVQFPPSELTVSLKTRVSRLTWAARIGIPATKLAGSINLMVLHEPNLFDKYPKANTCADVVKELTVELARIHALQVMYVQEDDPEAAVGLHIEAALAAKERESTGLFVIKPVVLH